MSWNAKVPMPAKS